MTSVVNLRASWLTLKNIQKSQKMSFFGAGFFLDWKPAVNRQPGFRRGTRRAYLFIYQKYISKSNQHGQTEIQEYNQNKGCEKVRNNDQWYWHLTSRKNSGKINWIIYLLIMFIWSIWRSQGCFRNLCMCDFSFKINSKSREVTNKYLMLTKTP